MIPQFNQNGVLPPYLPSSKPTNRDHTSPYRISMLELVQRFALSSERRSILRGLIQYRQALRAAGFEHGFQWIDGSFVEDCEGYRDRPPNDIDIVSFLHRPEKYQADESEFREFFYSTVVNLLDAKDEYLCDAYYVDLNASPVAVVKNTHYWFGLFTHQRETFVWKGMLEIPLQDDDESAMELLDEEVQHDS
ncbi:MAG: hypothetical protein H6657_07010 [Ardenticatenaceae bacterium]|nr:hypothetical protein [Ardenticatenaceae bacterium]